MTLLSNFSEKPDESPLACALALALSIPNAPASLESLCWLARMYLNLERPEKAVCLLDHAHSAANQLPADGPKWNTLLEIACIYAKARQYDLGVDIARSIGDSSRKSRALARICEQYGETGRHRDAELLANTIDDDGLRDRALASVARHYASQCDWEYAIEIAETIQSTREKIHALSSIEEEVGHNSATGNEIRARISALRNSLPKISRPELKCSEEDLKDRELYEEASKLIKMGEDDLALQLVPRLTDRSIHDLVGPITIRVAFRGAGSRELDLATKIAGEIRNASKRTFAEYIIAVAYADLGNRERFLEIIRGLDRSMLPEQTLVFHAGWLAHQKQFASALEVALLIQTTAARSQALAHAGMFLERYGFVLSDEIKVTLSRILAEAGVAPQPS
jgi:hypothetical protein